MRQWLDLSILFSPGVGSLQLYGNHRVVVLLFFQTVFWEKGLPHHFSVTLLRQSCPALCVFGGGQAGLHGNQFFELLFPCSFPPLLPGSEQKWLHPNLCPEQKNRILFLSLNPQKSLCFCMCPWKALPRTVHTHSDSVRGRPRDPGMFWLFVFLKLQAAPAPASHAHLQHLESCLSCSKALPSCYHASSLHPVPV